MENQDLSPELRQRLQQAVRNTEVPPYLETRIRARLSEAGAPGTRFWGLRWAAVATAVSSNCLKLMVMMIPFYV